jgi:hypothetical protein
MDAAPRTNDRRQSIRLKKHYMGRFSLKDQTSAKAELTQIENISQGGLAFTSRGTFKQGDVLIVELQTPFIAEKVMLEGVVLKVSEKIKGLIYQNHFKFQNVNAKSAEILKSIERFNAGQAL